jgi:hypothetical protein
MGEGARGEEGVDTGGAGTAATKETVKKEGLRVGKEREKDKHV